MWSFQYKHGDRPLDGYTIERAAGRGGFGEVYYAVSDSGREVALKAVQGYEQIELRGISQCMNLKSPHLVSIFDVKHNDQGRPFVIMEFVSGPSLRQLLDESPSGLGEQKSAFFLREIAKGLTYLHDCGIVHRDLKPGNIFYENGYVKIGDYGLSKAISVGQHSGQTVTVGTVHYMAPEVGVGKYDRSIDIYALGTCLYEMLTGTVPFIGSSPSEILMKHLSAEPDCSGIGEPFATVIKKAMAKDPTRRYQTVQEMVEAVFGAEHVRNSMSVFSADDLSMVAGRVAQKVGAVGIDGGSGPVVAAGAAAGIASAESSSVVGNQPVAGGNAWNRIGCNDDPSRDGCRQRFEEKLQRLRDKRERLVAGVKAWAIEPATAQDFADALANDPMSSRDRWLLAGFASLVVGVASAMLAPGRPYYPIETGLAVLFAAWGATFGVIGIWRWSLTWGKPQKANKFLVGLAGAVGASAVLPAGLMIPISNWGPTWLCIGAALMLVDATKWVNPLRIERVDLRAAAKAAVIALLCTWIFHGSGFLAIAIVAGAALMSQILSPWNPKISNSESNDQLDAAARPLTPPWPANGPPPLTPQHAAIGSGLAVSPADLLSSPASVSERRFDVSTGARVAWLVLFIISLTFGIMLSIAVGTNVISNHEQPVMLAFGVGALIVSLFALVRLFQRTYTSLWTYLWRPILGLLCVESIVLSSVVMANARRLLAAEQMIGTLFIVFPAILLLTLIFMPNPFASATTISSRHLSAAGVSPYRRLWALLLALLCFCGAAGIHRIYVGKIGTGILWLCTWGLCGVGQLIDVINLLTGQFTDAGGRPLLRWDDEPLAVAGGIAMPVGVAMPNGVGMPPVPPMPAAALPPRAESLGKVISRQVNEHVNNAMQVAREAIASSIPSPEDRKLAMMRELRERRLHESRRRWRAETRATGGGLFAVLATFVILASVIIGLAGALDLPGFIASGLPDPSLAQEIQTKFFGGYAEWPNLLRRIGIAGVGLTLVVGLAMTILARRKAGILHILRGTIGVLALVICLVPLSACVRNDHTWMTIAPLFKEHRVGQGIEQLVSSFAGPAPYVAGAIFLLAIILIAWPARRQARPQSAGAAARERRAE